MTSNSNGFDCTFGVRVWRLWRLFRWVSIPRLFIPLLRSPSWQVWTLWVVQQSGRRNWLTAAKILGLLLIVIVGLVAAPSTLTVPAEPTSQKSGVGDDFFVLLSLGVGMKRISAGICTTTATLVRSLLLAGNVWAFWHYSKRFYDCSQLGIKGDVYAVTTGNRITGCKCKCYQFGRYGLLNNGSLTQKHRNRLLHANFPAPTSTVQTQSQPSVPYRHQMKL